MSLPRAYLRIDPNMDLHPDQDAMLTLILFGNRCSERGRFRSLKHLEKLLGKKRLKACLDRKDLIHIEGGRYYVAGWDEWQEGDLTVGERMGRIRKRRSMEQKELDDRERNNAVIEPLQDRITGRNSPSEALGVDVDVETDLNQGRSVEGIATATPDGTPVKCAEGFEPTETAPRRLTPQALGIRVDPANFAQVQLSHDLTALVTVELREGPQVERDAKDIAQQLLHDISATPAGKRIETLDLRRVSAEWAAITSHAAYKLADEVYGVDLALVDSMPDKSPPVPRNVGEPQRPDLTLTVAPGACPVCSSSLRHATEGGETVLRCTQEIAPCGWAAVWRAVAA